MHIFFIKTQHVDLNLTVAVADRNITLLLII